MRCFFYIALGSPGLPFIKKDDQNLIRSKRSDEAVVSIVKASQKYAESFARAVDIVARERKYLASVTGFSLESTKDFIQMGEANDFAQYFALDGEKVIGWCDLIPKDIEGFTHVGKLGIGLLSEYRHQGIGSMLLQKTIEHAREKNKIEKIELEVFGSNVQAIKFYEKFGFQHEGRRINSRKLDGKYDHVVLMGKWLLGGNNS